MWKDIFNSDWYVIVVKMIKEKEDIFIVYMKVIKCKLMKIFVIIVFFKKNYVKCEEYFLGMVLLLIIIKWVLLVYIYCI